MLWRAGAGDMGNVLLAEYIRHHVPELANAEDMFCNSTGTASKPPILRKGVLNTVIFFPGLFNPPTINHAKLLRHVFRNAGQDLNIIGAIVFLLPDVEVRDRLHELGEGFEVFLTEKERRQLWIGPDFPVDWVYIFGPEQCEWLHLYHPVADAAARDGFDLRFLFLCGPEKFASNGGEEPEPPEDWGCSGWITSDVGCSADYVYAPVGEPVGECLNCTRWESVLPRAKNVRDIAKTKFMTGDPGDFEQVTAEDVRAEERRIRATTTGDWTCYRHQYPKGAARFVTAPPDPQRLEVFSSEIRHLIRCTENHHLPGIEPAISGIALNARDLLVFSVDWKDEMNLHEYDWEEYGDMVQEYLETVTPLGGGQHEGVDDHVPDEDTLYSIDLTRPNDTSQAINRETPVSAIRSTLFTHADGHHLSAKVMLTPNKVWGPNTYLNEDEGDFSANEEGDVIFEYAYPLPEV